MSVRFAVVGVSRIMDDPVARIANYLPGNYTVVGVYTDEDGPLARVVIAGEDNAGWTMDEYVLPRLASGNYWGTELVPDSEHN